MPAFRCELFVLESLSTTSPMVSRLTRTLLINLTMNLFHLDAVEVGHLLGEIAEGLVVMLGAETLSMLLLNATGIWLPIWG